LAHHPLRVHLAVGAIEGLQALRDAVERALH
jgi:hypothetical protein